MAFRVKKRGFHLSSFTSGEFMRASGLLEYLKRIGNKTAQKTVTIRKRTGCIERENPKSFGECFKMMVIISIGRIPSNNTPDILLIKIPTGWVTSQ
jgi:hypothetical protein